MPKKALIITYYWPPAGGPGVQRWLKFAKYLLHFDIVPIIYTPSNPSYPTIDNTLAEEIPKGIMVLKMPIKEPYRYAKILSGKTSNTVSKGIISERKKQGLLEKLMLFIRGNFFIPDARKYWVKPAIAYLSKYLKNNKVDAIITTGPPHSLHLIGLGLKKEFGTKWIADFRDPWTTIGYHKQLKLTKKSAKRHKLLEAEVLRNADQIIVTSPTTKTDFSQLTEKPIEVITNGYDMETSRVRVKLDQAFTMSHIGSLLSRRNPEVLWEALFEITKERTDFATDFKLNLVGSVSKEVLISLEKFNLSSYVNKIGYVSHNESIAYQKKSQVLLLIEIDSKETRSIIPGKLFEYMVSNRPILAIGPKNWDVEALIKQTNTGKCFYYDDLEHIKATILEYYQAYKQSSLESYPIGLEAFSRKSLTNKLAKLI